MWSFFSRRNLLVYNDFSEDSNMGKCYKLDMLLRGGYQGGGVAMVVRIKEYSQ